MKPVTNSQDRSQKPWYDRYGLPEIKEIYKKEYGIHLESVVESFFLSPEVPVAKILPGENGSFFYFFREDTTRHCVTVKKMTDHFTEILKYAVAGEILIKIEGKLKNSCGPARLCPSTVDESREKFIRDISHREEVKEFFRKKDIASIILLLFERIFQSEKVYLKFLSYHRRRKNIPENFIGYVIRKTTEYMLDRYGRYTEEQITFDESVLGSIVRRTARYFWHVFFVEIPSTAERLKRKDENVHSSYLRRPEVTEYFELFSSVHSSFLNNNNLNT